MTIGQAKSAVVIYHANCVDGFAAAWAFHTLRAHQYREGVKYIPCNYSNDTTPIGVNVDDVTRKDVFILDFSFNRPSLCLICDVANRVLVLDHHKTAKEALGDWLDHPSNLDIIFDMDRSGAGMTWDYFGDAHRPSLIEYVEDRDLWKFKLFKSREVSSFIGSVPHDFQEYSIASEHISKDLAACANIGTYLDKKHLRQCEEIIKGCQREIKIDGVPGLVCNCTYAFASDVGNLLAKKSGTFGASYYHAGDDSVKFSLRSIGEQCDVSAIAKKFGGGGHKNAAGFVLKAPEMQESGITLWSGGEESNVPSILP